MDQGTYRTQLRRVLDTQTETARQNLAGCLDALPEKAIDITIIVSPAQDGDGHFDVFVTLGGPDLYVLNKAIRAHFMLFKVQNTPEGRVPRLPLFDPFDTDFEVNDTIVDVAALWVQDVWQAVAVGRSRLPAAVYGDEDYGTITPLTLPI